jgi:hypothetical protein
VSPTTLWVVGKNCGESDEDQGAVAWDLIGVFDDRELAIAACKPGYFVGPAVLNEVLPDEARSWPGCFYPGDEAVAD